ncbi:MAG: TlpA disulfide reductase family protein [Bacteroidia bacterium]
MKNLLFTLVAVLLFSNLQGQEAEKEEGKPLPSVILTTLDGEEVDLQEYLNDGKPLIISLWATWCTPCKKELDNVSGLLDEWENKYGVRLLAISVDDSRNSMKVRPYIDGKGWEFHVLLDENSDTKRALNWATIPYTILVDKNRNIVYKHTGYTEGDEYELEDQLKALK